MGWVHVRSTCITFTYIMTSKRQGVSGGRVREPVQVYLDERDRELLERVAADTGLSRAEVLRRGLRTLATQTLDEGLAGGSLRALVGVLGKKHGVPEDLAEQHDTYLAREDARRARRSRVD